MSPPVQVLRPSKTTRPDPTLVISPPPVIAPLITTGKVPPKVEADKMLMVPPMVLLPS